MIELAARAYEKAVRETGKATRLAINISARQLATPDFEYQLCEILSGYNVSFDDICLEVTESLLIDNKELMASKMRSLTAKGFTFSIDDFGTGYSSLSYIKTLPIHELKIDKTFIDDIQSVDDEVPIVNAVFNLASSFGLNVVAEGVEDKAQSDYIWSKGEYLIQGYYFSRPLNVTDWITQLKANRECQKISNCVSENTIRSC